MPRTAYNGSVVHLAQQAFSGRVRAEVGQLEELLNSGRSGIGLCKDSMGSRLHLRKAADKELDRIHVGLGLSHGG